MSFFLWPLFYSVQRSCPNWARPSEKHSPSLRRAQSELKATLEHHMSELEKENESLKEVTRSFSSDIYNHYDSPSVEPYRSPAALESGNSFASNPSTTSASATQDAEPAVSHEIENGTVPRSEQAGYASHAAVSEPSGPLPEAGPAHG